MQVSDDQDYDSRFAQSKCRLVPLCLITLSLFLSCTTAAPSSEHSSSLNSQTVEEDPHQVLLRSLSTDQDSISKSIFVNLSKDAQALEKWEKSEGWIQLYQGQVIKALESFNLEAKSEQPDVVRSAHIGQIRSLLELSLSYKHLVEINQYLIPKWLTYERSRPNSKVHYCF